MKITEEFGMLDFRKIPHSFPGNTSLQKVPPAPTAQQEDCILRS